PHALDEVAAAADPERLEVGEGLVEHCEPSLDPLGEHLLTGDDAVALEQQLGEGAPALDRARGRTIAGAEHGLGQRPAALDLRLRSAPAAAAEPRPAGRPQR